MKTLFTSIIILFITNVYGQNVGVNQTNPTHSLHVSTLSGDPLRIDGLNNLQSGDNKLLIVNPSSGVIRVIPMDQLSDSISSYIINNQQFSDSIISIIYNHGDTLLYNNSFVTNLADSIDTHVDSVTLAGTILTVWVNGNASPVDLSPLGVGGGDNWGTQVIVSGAGFSGDGTTTNPLNYTETDGVIGNEYNTNLQVNGGNLELTDGGGTLSVPISALSTNTDNQNLSNSTSGANVTLNISGGTGTTFSVNDADSNPANEFNTGFSLTATNLEITDGGGTLSVPISSIQSAVQDDDWYKAGTSTPPTSITDNIYTQGYVGINGTPGASLHIYNNAAGDGTDDIIVQTFRGTTTNTPSLRLRSARGLSTGTTSIQNTDVLGNIHFEGYDGTINQTGASIVGVAESNYTSSNYSAGLRFYTTSATTYSEKMRITNNGNIGINTNAPTAKLDVNGSVRLRGTLADATNNVGTVGQVLTSTGTGTQWVTNVAITPSILGTLSSTTNSISVSSTQTYTGSYIDLPPGKWAVQVVTLINMSTQVQDDETYWIRSTFSESATTYSVTADFQGSNLYSAPITGPTGYGIISGVNIINNTTASTKRYYYWKTNCDFWGTNATSTKTLVNFGTGLWGENQIVAQPIN